MQFWISLCLEKYLYHQNWPSCRLVFVLFDKCWYVFPVSISTYSHVKNSVFFIRLCDFSTSHFLFHAYELVPYSLQFCSGLSLKYPSFFSPFFSGGWVGPTEFSRTGWIQSVLLADISEWSAGAPWSVRIAFCRSWLLVAPIMWPRERTKVIAANLASRRRATAVLLSWSTWVFVVLLSMKMYEHSFSSFFLLF